MPTRITGWQAGVLETLAFLEREPTTLEAMGSSGDTSLDELAQIFAALQKEFAQRLGGDGEDVAMLVDSQRAALASASKRSMTADIWRFVDISVAVLRSPHPQHHGPSPVQLPALEEVCRPIHPRYAPVDPVEPLPWHTRNPERHFSRMKRLGYTL